MPKNNATDPYDPEHLEKALAEVRDGREIREIARKFQNPLYIII